MSEIRLQDLPPMQRRALQACVRGGQLRRGPGGYTGAESQEAFNSRTVYALERAGLVDVVEGTSVVRATETGRALLGDLSGRKPEAVHARRAAQA